MTDDDWRALSDTDKRRLMDRALMDPDQAIPDTVPASVQAMIQDMYTLTLLTGMSVQQIDTISNDIKELT